MWPKLSNIEHSSYFDGCLMPMPWNLILLLIPKYLRKSTVLALKARLQIYRTVLLRHATKANIRIFTQSNEISSDIIFLLLWWFLARNVCITSWSFDILKSSDSTITASKLELQQSPLSLFPSLYHKRHNSCLRNNPCNWDSVTKQYTIFSSAINNKLPMIIIILYCTYLLIALSSLKAWSKFPTVR